MPILERLFSESPDAGMWAVSSGVVRENYDKDHPGMVKVELLMKVSGHGLTNWMRVASPYAGKAYGMYFLPEVGDEVLVAVDHFDTQTGYVIGSLWNEKNTRPTGVVTEKNLVKKLITKGNNEISFGDEDGNQTVTVKTKGDLTVLLDDDKKTITLSGGENSIKLDSQNGKIEITAKSSIKLETGGQSLTLDGTGKKATLKGDSCAVDGTQKTDIKGANLTVKGTSVTVEGSGSLNVKSDGVLTVKGSMVKIN